MISNLSYADDMTYLQPISCKIINNSLKLFGDVKRSTLKDLPRRKRGAEDVP